MKKTMSRRAMLMGARDAAKSGQAASVLAVERDGTGPAQQPAHQEEERRDRHVQHRRGPTR